MLIRGSLVQTPGLGQLDIQKDYLIGKSFINPSRLPAIVAVYAGGFGRIHANLQAILLKL